MAGQWRARRRNVDARGVGPDDALIDESEPRRPTGWTRHLFIEPRRIEAVRRRPDAYWFVVGAVGIGAFMGQLDASIVTIAFPTLQRAFNVHVGAVTWVGLSYLISLVAFVTIVGRFADMVGRKLLYVYGFGLFALASAGCALAPNLPALVGLRVVQGVGAAMLQANSLAIINIAAPAGKLGRAIGVQGAAQALGLA
ncbi:MAG: MFS transporter, partial [Acidimicrobiales bacterium]